MQNEVIERELEALRDAQSLLKEARARAKNIRDRVDLDFAFQQIARAMAVIRNLQVALRKKSAGASSPDDASQPLPAGGEESMP